MNRTILIVICDFLLVSLLAFSTVDINKLAEGGQQQRVNVNVSTNQPESGRDLAAAMRLALDEERKHRDQLIGELSRAREASSEQQQLLSERERQAAELEAQLRAREQKAAELEGQMRARAQQAAELQEQVREREEQAREMAERQAQLQAQFAAAQTNLVSLQERLKTGTTETVLTRERLAAMQEEARKQAERAAELQKQLESMVASNQLAQAERQKLATQLQVAEVERKHAAEQVARMAEEVKLQREERARLADNMKALASRSSELVQEIRENRPMTPNMIFNEFLTNRLAARFSAYRTGFLGDASRREQTYTVMVTDGTNTYALCHVQDTPLTLWSPGTDWASLTGTLRREDSQVSIHSLSFLWPDPRVVWMPLTATEAKQLGGRVYQISSDPYKFQDCVLVGARQGYYGECRFQIDPQAPRYVQLDRSFLRGLFGQFNPSRGDLVFSKTGELLGVMVNESYCLMIQKFESAATLKFGTDVRSQRTGETLAALHGQVTQLPSKLQ